MQKLQRELIDGDFTEMGKARREAFLRLGCRASSPVFCGEFFLGPKKATICGALKKIAKLVYNYNN